VVALRKNISRSRGEQVLFDEVRYFFYITTCTDLTAEEIVACANERCDQENEGHGGLAAHHQSGPEATQGRGDCEGGRGGPISANAGNQAIEPGAYLARYSNCAVLVRGTFLCL
jgi:hypothetical protein